MLKTTDCKIFSNYIGSTKIDYFDLLDYIDNKESDKFENKIKNYLAIKMQNKTYNNDFVIIHRSSKKDNKIQISYFDDKGAYSDKEFSSLKDAIRNTLIFKSYKIVEVI